MSQGKNEVKVSLKPLLAFTPTTEKNERHPQVPSPEKKEMDSKYLFNSKVEPMPGGFNDNTMKGVEAELSMKTMESMCHHHESGKLDHVTNNYEYTLSCLEEENEILKSHLIKSQILRLEKEKVESVNAKLSADNLNLAKKMEWLLSENNSLQSCVGTLEQKLSQFDEVVKERDQLRIQVAKERDNNKDSTSLQQLVKSLTNQCDALKQQQELAENTLKQMSNELREKTEIGDKLLVLANQLYSQNEQLHKILLVISSTKEFYRKCCHMKLENLNRKLFEAESTRSLLSDRRFSLALRKIKMILYIAEYFKKASPPSSQTSLLMQAFYAALFRLSTEMEEILQSVSKALEDDACHALNRTFSDPDTSAKNLAIESGEALFLSPKSMMISLCPDDKTLVDKLFSAEGPRQIEDENASQHWLDELEKENQNLKSILLNTNKEVEQLNSILIHKRSALGQYQKCLSELSGEVENIYSSLELVDDKTGNQNESFLLALEEGGPESLKFGNLVSDCLSQPGTNFSSVQKMLSALKCGVKMPASEPECSGAKDAVEGIKQGKATCIDTSSQEGMNESKDQALNSEERIGVLKDLPSSDQQVFATEPENKIPPVACMQKMSVAKLSPSSLSKLTATFSETEDLRCILKKLESFPALYQLFSKSFPVLLNLFSNFQITIKAVTEPSSDEVILIDLDKFEDEEIPYILQEILFTRSDDVIRVFFTKDSQENYLCLFTPKAENSLDRTFSINVDSKLSWMRPDYSDTIFVKLNELGSFLKPLVELNNKIFIMRNEKSIACPRLDRVKWSAEILNSSRKMYSGLDNFDNKFCKIAASNSGTERRIAGNASLASTTVFVTAKQIPGASCEAFKIPVNEVSKYSLVVRTPGTKDTQGTETGNQLRKLVSQLTSIQRNKIVCEFAEHIQICEIKILLMDVLQKFLSGLAEERLSSFLGASASPTWVVETDGGHNQPKLQPEIFSCTPETHSELIFSVLEVMELMSNVSSCSHEPSKVHEVDSADTSTSCSDDDSEISLKTKKSSESDLPLPIESPKTTDHKKLQVLKKCASTKNDLLSTLLSVAEALSHEICKNCNTINDAVDKKTPNPDGAISNILLALKHSRAHCKSEKMSKRNWFTEINLLRLKNYRLRKQVMSLKSLKHSELEENMDKLNTISVQENETENVTKSQTCHKQELAELEKELVKLNSILNQRNEGLVGSDVPENTIESAHQQKVAELEEEILKLKEELNRLNKCLVLPNEAENLSAAEESYEQVPSSGGECFVSKGTVPCPNETHVAKDEAENIKEVKISYEQKIADLEKGFEEKLTELKNSHNKDFKSLSQIYVEKLKLAEEIYAQNIESTEESNLRVLKDYQHFYTSKLKEWEALMDQFSQTLVDLQKTVLESEEKFSEELSNAVNKYETLLRLVSEVVDNEKVAINETLHESLRTLEAEYRESLKAITVKLDDEAAYSRRLIVKEVEACKRLYENNLKKQKTSYKSLLEEARKSYERKQLQKRHLSFSKVLSCNCHHAEDAAAVVECQKSAGN